MKQMTALDKVRQFHDVMGQELDVEFRTSLLELRERLLREEYIEVINEVSVALMELERDGFVSNGTREALIKELADLKYVLNGFAATFGIDLDVAFNRVHESNMSKLGDDGKPIRRLDGKVMKGPNYQPPSMHGL